MKAVSMILAGGVGLAALAGAVPAAAQYYPSPYPPQQSPYGYGYGQSGGLGAIIDQILGGNRYAQGVDQRQLVEQCIAAVTNRVARNYSNRSPYGTPYGYGGGYGAYGQSSARVLGVTDIDRRSSGLRVRGTATANAQMAVSPYGSPYGAPYGQGYGGYNPGYGGYNPGYGGGYNQGYVPQQVGELTFRCDVDYRGRVRDIDLGRNRNAYAYPYPYRR